MEASSQRHLRLLGGRSTPFKTLVGLFITALFFMLFQASILENLQGLQTSKKRDSETQHARKEDQPAPDKNLLVVAAPRIPERINPKFAPKLIGIKINGTILRGVQKLYRKYYVPSNDGIFMCLSGNQNVTWNAVNNDHCDCADGSDEPGTSACKNGRFFCEPDYQYIPSVRVNDGICDCCDGSDEWKGITLQPNVDIPDKVNKVPCHDLCMDEEHQKIRELNLMKEATKFKKVYLDEGAAHVAQGKFGPKGEFYKLSLECFNFKSPRYVYKICPYLNATQSGADFWVIGRHGDLKGTIAEGYKLVMSGGANDACPRGESRTTILNFKCGPVEEIKYVSEKQPCIYSVKFDTPAACPDIETMNET